MILFKVVNDLVVDIIVGLILAIIKAFARIEDITLGDTKHPSKNVFLEHKYDHWEQSILWLEDITESKFSYMESQVRFLTGLIGIFYGCVVGLFLFVADIFLGFIVHPFNIITLSFLFGTILGYLGGKSLVDRPQIFDRKPEEFKGENFDK